MKAYLHKYDKSIIKELVERGFINLINYIPKEDLGLITFNGKYFTNLHDKNKEAFDLSEYVDCGDNSELFLAISAIREDTDKHQWFCTDDEDVEDKLFFLCL